MLISFLFIKIIYKFKKFELSLTVEDCNHNNSKRSKRISVKIYIIHPLHSGHRDEVIISRHAYVQLKRNE